MTEPTDWMRAGFQVAACGEYGGSDSHVSVGRFLGNEHGYAEPGVVNHVFLQCVSCHGCKARVQTVVESLACPGVSTVYRPQHTGVACVDEPTEGVGDFHAIGAFDGVHLPSEGAKELSCFLFDGHAAEEVGHTGVGGKIGVEVVAFFGAGECGECQ